MEKELDEYSLAFKAHLKAQQAEIKCKLDVQKSYYRLLRAKEALKARERELLEDLPIKASK